MAKKKSKAKYRAAAKTTQSDVSSTTSQASTSAHQFGTKEDKAVEDDTKSKAVKDLNYELSEIEFLQKIFDSYFEGYCASQTENGSSEICFQCKKSADPHSADKPCWYGTTESTGRLLKKYVLDGCLKETKDPDPLGEDRRSFFMSSFTELLVKSLFYKEHPIINPSTGMPASDIQHLKAIAPQDMYNLYTQSPHAPVRDAFIELLNLVHLMAWKMIHVEKYADEDHTVHRFLNRTRKKAREKAEYLSMMEHKTIVDDVKTLTHARNSFASILGKSNEDNGGVNSKLSNIRIFREYIIELAFGPFERISLQMLMFLLTSSQCNNHFTTWQPESTAKFFENYDSYFVKLFSTEDTNLRPNFIWLDCLTHNIRMTFKLLWICAQRATKSFQMPNFYKSKFRYPIQVTQRVREGLEYLGREQCDLWRRWIFETYTFETPDNEVSVDDDLFKQHCKNTAPIMNILFRKGFNGEDLGNIGWYLWHKNFYKGENLTMNDHKAIDSIMMPCFTERVLPLENDDEGKS